MDVCKCLPLPTSNSLNSFDFWIGNFAKFTDKGLCVSIEFAKSLVRMTDTKIWGIWGMPAICTFTDITFWGICLVENSVWMVDTLSHCNHQVPWVSRKSSHCKQKARKHNCKQRQTNGKQEASNYEAKEVASTSFGHRNVKIASQKLFGWHFCRTKLPQNAQIPKQEVKRIVKQKVQKMRWNVPQKFKALLSRLNTIHQPFSQFWTRDFKHNFKPSACAPLCCNNLCCASRFCTGGRGAAGSRSTQMSKVPWSEMLAQGNNLSYLLKSRELLTAGFLYRAGAETPLNFRENFRVFPRTILEIFAEVDTQTAVLVSTAEVWISGPDTQTPIFLGFLGIHSWLWFFCREMKSFGSMCIDNSPGACFCLRGPYTCGS